MKRIFLGWNRPALTSAVDWLIERTAAAREAEPARAESSHRATLELSGTIVAVPGSRAGRRLLELLIDRCSRERMLLEPPEIVTLGRLPEMLYEAQRPLADDLLQRLAWVEALKGLHAMADEPHRAHRDGDSGPSSSSPPLFQRPPDEDLEAWMALAAMFARLHRELAADALDCESVAARGERLDGFGETWRWRLLARTQRVYLQTLDRLGLWDRQTARLFAIRQGECRVERDVVLLGLVDMNRSQRMMLDQLSERVTVLIFAPPELAERFDQHGCLQPKAWLEAGIKLPDECIELVDAPADQAAAVARAVASFDGRFSAEQISVGVPEVQLVPHIQRRLGQHDVPSRYGVGRAITLSAPYRFLADAAAYVDGRDYVSFASLVRHPHVGDWLRRQGFDGDWLTALDRCYQLRMPHQLERTTWHVEALAGQWPQDVPGGQEPEQSQYMNLTARLHKAVEGLVGVLDGPPRPLGDWGRPLLELLLAVFAQDVSGGKKKLDRYDVAEREVIAVCEKIQELLRVYGDLPPGLIPKLSGAEAVRFVLRELEGETVAPLPRHGAVELLGWLELPWDDAPAMIITGMNDGVVPAALNADLFLPNKLRRALGIEDNDRRYARDAYALSLLAASRRELRLIAGRRTADGDPQSPTRLFFAADEETIARRAAAFFADEPSSSAENEPLVLHAVHETGREQSLLQVPAPRALCEPVRSMRVTEFRDYLACPYRYYLRHQLKLAALDDAAVELDAAAFGTLAHELLRRFGRSDLSGATSADAIFAFLSDTLDQVVRQTYGSRPLAAIRVQVEQLRRRLEAFARWQAGWAAKGWQIMRVESAPQADKASITVDDRPMLLRGRIDRIDVNAQTGRMALLDYKTSDTARTPRQAHLVKGDWIDLQLPLYRHLVAGMELDSARTGTDEIEMGYVVLPKDANKTGCLKADWSEAELREADTTAARVIRAVRKQRFFPPSPEPPAFAEEFAAICQDTCMGRPLLEGQDGVLVPSTVDHSCCCVNPKGDKR